ncbi:MAG TPA: DUF5677 domain-containing protein [Gemmatimonadaceae bacterium]
MNFHAKQLHHVEGILRLESHADTALLARSMLEGLCLLKWAAQEPVTRPLTWRAFSLVIDWRTLRKDVAVGVPEADAKVHQLEERIAEHGDDLLNSKAIDSRSRGVPPPSDPYVKTWYKPQLRQIFEAVGASELYDGPYYQMSEWHHWSAGGLAQAMRFDDQMMSFSPRSPMIQTASLANAYQCLAETAQLVDEHFELNAAAEIAEMINAFVAEHAALSARPQSNDR